MGMMDALSAQKQLKLINEAFVDIIKQMNIQEEQQNRIIGLLTEIRDDIKLKEL